MMGAGVGLPRVLPAERNILRRRGKVPARVASLLRSQDALFHRAT